MNILLDERGSTFLENALWIIVFVMAVAVFAGGLAEEVGSKMDEMRERVGSVGTP